MQIFQQHRKLITAESPNHIAGTQALPNPLANQYQQFIAAQMPQAVVHNLEAVQVQ